jgi:hypothetical protein
MLDDAWQRTLFRCLRPRRDRGPVKVSKGKQGRRTSGFLMDIVYGIGLLAALALVLMYARRSVKKARETRAREQRRKRKAAKRRRGTDSSSPRSDMRATDSPVTIIDTIQKRHKSR